VEGKESQRSQREKKIDSRDGKRREKNIREEIIEREKSGVADVRVRYGRLSQRRGIETIIIEQETR